MTYQTNGDPDYITWDDPSSDDSPAVGWDDLGDDGWDDTCSPPPTTDP